MLTLYLRNYRSCRETLAAATMCVWREHHSEWGIASGISWLSVAPAFSDAPSTCAVGGHVQNFRDFFFWREKILAGSFQMLWEASRGQKLIFCSPLGIGCSGDPQRGPCVDFGKHTLRGNILQDYISRNNIFIIKYILLSNSHSIFLFCNVHILYI